MSAPYLTWVLHAPTDLRVDEREVGPIGSAQVLVRVGMGGICGSHLHDFHHGGFGAIRVKEPMALGHSTSMPNWRWPCNPSMKSVWISRQSSAGPLP